MILKKYTPKQLCTLGSGIFCITCMFFFVRVCVAPPQAWRPLWAPWSSLWRSCRTWWSLPSSAWASLPSSACNSSWETCARSAWSGQSTWPRPTPTALRTLTGMSTSTTKVSDDMASAAVELAMNWLFYFFFYRGQVLGVAHWKPKVILSCCCRQARWILWQRV